jgi:hypothetical protein
LVGVVRSGGKDPATRRWDHYAPHVHTVFAEYEARIVIETLELLAESFGKSASWSWTTRSLRPC